MRSWKNSFWKVLTYTLLTTLLIGTTVFVGQTAVSQTSGVAVAQYRPSTTTSPNWINVKDGSMGDDLDTGVMAVGLYTWDEVTGNWDRMRGKSVTSNAYSILRANLGTSSVNHAFGFTSRKVRIVTPSTNTQNVCIDWLGGTAVCPAANTAGDGVLIPNQSLILDDLRVTSISAIAASGTQTVNIQAWN